MAIGLGFAGKYKWSMVTLSQTPADPCPPLDSNSLPLEEGWGQTGGGRGVLPPEVCAWVVGTSMEVKMLCVWCVDQGGGAERNRASLGEPDGCGCVLIYRAGPFG